MKPQTATSKIGRELPAATLPDPLWTVEDVAHYLRLRQETVRTMARDGRLPSVKVGKKWRFYSDQVKSLLFNGIKPVKPQNQSHKEE